MHDPAEQGDRHLEPQPLRGWGKREDQESQVGELGGGGCHRLAWATE